MWCKLWKNIKYNCIEKREEHNVICTIKIEYYNIPGLSFPMLAELLIPRELETKGQDWACFVVRVIYLIFEYIEAFAQTNTAKPRLHCRRFKLFGFCYAQVKGIFAKIFCPNYIEGPQ